MLGRVATRVVQVGIITIGTSALLALAMQGSTPLPTPASQAPAGCRGWTTVRLPALELVDVVAPREDDVWLLSTRGVYHFDGCTWRAHMPFANLSHTIIDWETIVEDPDGALVVTGVSPAGPNVVIRGCGEHDPCCGMGPSHPAERRSYRFVRGAATWEPIEPRSPATPEIDGGVRLEDARTRGAVPPDDRPDELRMIAMDGPFAIAQRHREIGSRDHVGRHIGWGGLTTTELWRNVRGTWVPMWSWQESPPRVDLKRIERPELAGHPDFGIDAMGGSSAHDQWAVGFRSGAAEIMHFDGTRWTSHRGRFSGDLPIHATGHLTGVASTSPSDAWVIGAWGTVLHFDGLFWAKLDKPSFENLVEVTALPGFVQVRDAAGGVFVWSD